ncbi:MAG: hypothetical protein U0103_13305 [Candidatus Obscuribacterales bacterium]
MSPLDGARVKSGSALLDFEEYQSLISPGICVAAAINKSTRHDGLLSS